MDGPSGAAEVMGRWQTSAPRPETDIRVHGREADLRNVAEGWFAVALAEAPKSLCSPTKRANVQP